MSYKKLREAIDLLETFEVLKALNDKLQSEPATTEMHHSFGEMFGQRTMANPDADSSIEYLKMAFKMLELQAKPQSEPASLLNAPERSNAEHSNEPRLQEQIQELMALKNAMENAYNAMVVADVRQKIIYVNKAFEKNTGYTFEEVKGRNPRLLQGPDTNKETTKRIRQKLAAREPVSETLLNYTKDGRPYWVNIKIRAVIDGNGTCNGFVGIEEDVTEIRRIQSELQHTQSQLIQSEKLSSLGQMVAGLAHEMNTPLAFVRSNMEVLAKKDMAIQNLLSLYFSLRHKITSGDTDGVPELIGSIDALTEDVTASRAYRETESLFSNAIQGIDRIQDLVLNLKNFSRLDEADSKATDINGGLEATLTIAAHLLKDGIDVERHYGELPNVMCSPAQLNQVFLNVITNAVQSMNANGKLTIRTKAVGSNVHIEIEDNGKGMDDKTLARIFEPFFTTKDVGQGTGLGLSIAYKIIENHKGKISVKSEVGKGTVFTIELPAASDATPEPPAARNEPMNDDDSPFDDSPFTDSDKDISSITGDNEKTVDITDQERAKWKTIVDKVTTKS